MKSEQMIQLIEQLEMKVAFQDDTIEQLNLALQDQQLQIDLLKQQIKLVGTKLGEIHSSPVASQSEEVPPPHY